MPRKSCEPPTRSATRWRRAGHASWELRTGVLDYIPAVLQAQCRADLATKFPMISSRHHMIVGKRSNVLKSIYIFIYAGPSHLTTHLASSLLGTRTPSKCPVNKPHCDRATTHRHRMPPSLQARWDASTREAFMVLLLGLWSWGSSIGALHGGLLLTALPSTAKLSITWPSHAWQALIECLYIAKLD